MSNPNPNSQNTTQRAPRRRNRRRGAGNKNPNPKTGAPNPVNTRPQVQLGTTTLTAPSAVGARITKRMPYMRSLPNGDSEGYSCEYVRLLSGSVAFAVSQLSLNPGQPGTFPWLSGYAQLFESYRFEQLRIEYVPSCATTSTGNVVLMVDYDASDSAPVSIMQAFNSRSSRIVQPWAGTVFEAVREDLEKQKTYFVRSGSLSSNQDVKMYDTGTINICRQGQADTSNIGSILIEARVRFMTPQQNNPQLGTSKYGTFTGSSNAAPFATSSGNLPATVQSSGTTTSVSTWTFQQPWAGVMALYAVGTGLSGSNLTVGGTGTNTELKEVEAGGTDMCAAVSVNVQQDQSLIITIGNTTLTSVTGKFGQGDL